MFNILQPIDSDILLWIQNSLRSDILNKIMIPFTSLGNHGILFIVLTLAALLFARTRKAGAASAIALLIGYILTSILIKPLVARPRPYVITEGLNALVDMSRDPYSFPSGHTCAAFGLAFAWLRTMPYTKVRVSVFIIAVLMGFSRLYVAVHNPSDVIAGALFGALSGLIATILIKAWDERKKADSH
jgi:undecaprenyl-diphosphatase